MRKRFLEAGRFVTIHGVRGELKALPFGDAAEQLCGLHAVFLGADGEQKLAVLSVRRQQRMLLFSLAGVDSPEKARLLVNRIFYAAREDIVLPPGRFFMDDLIGFSVVDDGSGRVYGRVTAVTNGGAGDLYEVATPDGRRVLFPAVRPFLSGVYLDEELIRVKPIGGMFDDAD